MAAPHPIGHRPQHSAIGIAAKRGRYLDRLSRRLSASSPFRFRRIRGRCGRRSCLSRRSGDRNSRRCQECQPGLRRDWLAQIAQVCLAVAFSTGRPRPRRLQATCCCHRADLRRIGLWFRCAAGRSCLSLSLLSEPLQYSSPIAGAALRSCGSNASAPQRFRLAIVSRRGSDGSGNQPSASRLNGTRSGSRSSRIPINGAAPLLRQRYDSRSDRTFTSSLSCRTISAVLRMSASSRATPMVEAIAKSWTFSSP